MEDTTAVDPRLSLAKERVEVRDRARTDKMYLANEILGYDFQPCHQELFDLYPTFAEGKPWAEQIATKEDIMVIWSRGHYKSTAVKVIIIQAILNNPDIAILCMQGSIAVTQLFIAEVYKHFSGEAEGSKLQEFFPEFCGTKKEMQGSAMRFTVPCRVRKQIPQATVTVASPKAIKTGQHYDLGVFDDLQNESNYRSPKLLLKVQQDYQGCQPLVQNGARWVSGTRWAFGDLYEQIIRWDTEGKWIISVKDCWSDDKSDVRFPKYIKKNGQVGGFTRESLMALQLQDPAFFACQYLNKPIHEGNRAITKEEMEAACIDGSQAPYMSTAVLIVDVAATNTIASDDCVIQAGAMDLTGIVYVRDQIGGQWQPMELATHIVTMALKHRPVKVMLEGSASGKVFEPLLKMVARQYNVFITTEFIKVNNQDDAKNIRVLGWAGQVKRGRFKFFKGLAKWDKLVQQATEFPKGRNNHDDYPDTCALLYQELTKNFCTLPMPPKPVNPIIALINDAERNNALTNSLVRPQLSEWDEYDQIGLE
jgi:predicted phage terminase large subunit-like protein